MTGYLPSLRTATAEQGFELALKLSRLAVKMTQPSEEIRTRLRSDYEVDADSLIQTSLVVATNFQTIAAANRYWVR